MFLLEINFGVPESQWLKTSCHVIKHRLKQLENYLKKPKNTPGQSFSTQKFKKYNRFF